MTAPSAPAADSDLYAAHPDLSRLLNALRRARGFGLYFARCNSPAYRSRLVEAIYSRLPRPVVHLVLEADETSTLDARLEAALTNAASDAVVFIFQLEDLLPSGDPICLKQTLSELNWRRGALARLQRPLVFWLPEYALNLLASGAPDFYDWYSGVYQFDLPQPLQAELRQRAFQELADFTAVTGLTLEEKRQWRTVLHELVTTSDDQTEVERQTLVRLLNRQGKLAHVEADYDLAKTAYERALQIDETMYGRNHPNVARDVNNLGRVLQAQGDLIAARDAYGSALKIDEAAFGCNHPEVARDVNNLGRVLQAQGDLTAARSAYERALRIFINFLGPDHPDTKLVQGNLEALNEE